ncbi:MAG: PEP-CTERM sorting domain-containing protein [Pirellulales bacterium]|nr:PEP-CTERM sorting domain-containing protein [Pirellulales bacterium]
MTSGKFTRSGQLVRSIATLALVGALLEFITPLATADVTGSIGQNFFNGFTINEGSSGSAVLQLFVTPANSSGFAGTTTHRINAGNPLTFSAPGSTGGATPTTGGDFGNGTANWSASFQYNLPGVYNVSYGGTVSWLHSANGSYNPVTGNYSGTGFQGVGSNINVTVLNVAPTITSANLNGTNGGLSVGQGASVTANMTATDAGSDDSFFTINGAGAGSASAAPGGTRTSSNVGVNTVLAPGIYTQTYVVADTFGSGNITTTRNLTITNVGPSITAARVNGVNGDQTIAQGNGATLNMSATDPGGDTINYTINGAGAGSSPSGGNSSNVATGTFLAPGVYTQTYQAADTFGGSSGTLTRNITVTNVAPTITSANQDGTNGNITVLQGASVTLNLTATDPGNDTMSFTINGGGAGSTGVQAGGSTRTSADNAVQYFTPGVFTNTFQATDQYGANASNGPATRDVTVLNVAPVITSLLATDVPNILGNGCLMFFTATSTDPGILDSAIYSWDLNGDNIFGDYVSVDPAPPWSSTTPTILYGLGTHTIGVMVTDNWGGFDPINGVAYLTFECLPEPSTWVAILLSGGALAFFHRRKKRKT